MADPVNSSSRVDATFHRWRDPHRCRHRTPREWRKSAIGNFAALAMQLHNSCTTSHPALADLPGIVADMLDAALALEPIEGAG